MEILIKIIAWVILALLLTTFPEQLQASRQRYRVTPIVVYSLIIINTLIYIIVLLVTLFHQSTFYEAVIDYWGCRPYDLLHPELAGSIAGIAKSYVTLFTYQFLHGGFFHLMGNMYFLYIFGPGVEMGQNIRLRGRDRKPFNSYMPFIIFYLLCGVGSALSHTAFFGFGEVSKIVMVGASGAISGILGAYLVGLWKDYNKIKIRVFYYFPFIISVNFYILYWIVLQIALFIATGSMSSVSYAGHIGGFFTGLILWTFVCPWTEIIVSMRARGWFRASRRTG
jgi:membrane associated rhomboid family serine protease